MSRHEGEQERAHHERDAEHSGRFAQKRGRTASTEQALGRTSSHTERTGEPAALPRLEKDDQNQKHTNEKMNAQDQRVDQRTLPRNKRPDIKGPSSLAAAQEERQRDALGPAARTMPRKLLLSSDAPPTSAPSTPGQAMSSAAF